MELLDWIVVFVYFTGMAWIGYICMKKIKKQDDLFLGGRSFGKLMQTFAAFGAGTGSSDPINVSRTTFTSGLAGIWSVMYFLFVTPIYWFAAVWYRRMRHTTLGDWFTERYESKKLGAAYAIFGLALYTVYIALLFAAISKFVAPLFDVADCTFLGMTISFSTLLLIIVAIIVVIYGALGGIAAAYITDLVQGICIIILSIMLIPFGLNKLVEKHGVEGDGIMDGFKYLHQQLPEDFFSLFGGADSTFSFWAVIAIVLINMIGIVIYPHFILVGGGTAKNEKDARIGLVTGNILKRFCTVGWALTALISLALYAGVPELNNDPDMVWGYSAKMLLPAGLTGLMLSCLLAALMSSVDTYMISSSALVVKNVYVPFFNQKATDKQCIKASRITSVLLIAGAICITILMEADVFKLLIITWSFPVLFASLFWLGLFWKRANTTAAWITLSVCLLAFLILPIFSTFSNHQFLTETNNIVIIEKTRKAAASDVQKNEAKIKLWQKSPQGQKPAPIKIGAEMLVTHKTGGTPIFWSGAVKPKGEVKYKIISQSSKDGINKTVKAYDCELVGSGYLKLDYLAYKVLVIDLSDYSTAALKSMELPVKVLFPFIVMIIASLLTKPNSEEALQRYFTKMATPVVQDPEGDLQAIEQNYQNYEVIEQGKLIPGSSLEIQKFTKFDIIGFIVIVAICFSVVGLILLMASTGS